MSHISVLLDEVLHFFSDMQLHTFFEGTVGAGGHAAKFLQCHPEIKQYIACDRDPTAIELSKGKLQPWEDKILWMQRNFAEIESFFEEHRIENVDGFFLI